MSEKPLLNKTYLLTGASRGIGALTARRLIGLGARVIVVARDRVALELLQDELDSTAEGSVMIKPFDLTVREALISWTESLWEEFGPLDGVIHNAGVDDFQPSQAMSPEGLMRQVDLNLTAPLLINRALLPHFLDRDRGVFIHLSSVAGYIPTPFGSVYSATKAALWIYSEALAIEHFESSLSFVSVHPGFVHGSGMHERHKERAGPAPMILGGTTDEEVAEAICVALKRGERSRGGPVIVNRLPTRPFILLLHAAPRFARWIMSKIVRPYLAKVATPTPKQE